MTLDDYLQKFQRDNRDFSGKMEIHWKAGEPVEVKVEHRERLDLQAKPRRSS